MNQFQIHIQFQSNWKYNSESKSIEIQIQIENWLHSNLKFQPNCPKSYFQFSIQFQDSKQIPNEFFIQSKWNLQLQFKPNYETQSISKAIQIHHENPI
jgi:hypothetical protein